MIMDGGCEVWHKHNGVLSSLLKGEKSCIIYNTMERPRGHHKLVTEGKILRDSTHELLKTDL